MKMQVSTQNGGTLNLRNTPGGMILSKIPNGTILDVEIDGEWAKTTYKSNTGYIMTKYLISIDSSSSITKQQLQKIYNSLNSTLKLIEEVLK